VTVVYHGLDCLICAEFAREGTWLSTKLTTLSSKLGTYKTVTAGYKTVNARHKTVKASSRADLVVNEVVDALHVELSTVANTPYTLHPAPKREGTP